MALMIAILSPAKTFDRIASPVSVAPGKPFFEQEAHALARSAARITRKKLGALMHISPELAALNAARFQGFQGQEARPAILSFAGDVYRGFDAASLDEETQRFAEAHVRILSGLYGLLRPSDAIRPYRIEMGTPWAPRVGDLYRFWKGRIARQLEKELGDEGSGTLVNLASKEYWRAVEPHLAPGVRVVTIDFRDAGPKGLHFNTFAAKKARGAMARFMCDERIGEVAALTAFDAGGYAFDADGSSADFLRFVRK